MSRITRRSMKSSKATDGTYVLYCINVHGTGLKSIRETFLKQAQTGTRRTFFAIDLDAEIIKRQQMEEQSDSRRGSALSKPVIGLHPAMVALSCIDNCRAEYDKVTEKLETEMKFNIMDFWIKEGDTRLSILPPHVSSTSKGKQTGTKGRKSNRLTKESSMFIEASCPPIKTREHNRVGRPKKLMNIDYINDSPYSPNLIIVFIGHISRTFIYDLLQYKEPLKGVVDFLPEKSDWDIMMRSTDIETFLTNTLEGISLKYFELRQVNLTKSLGLFKESIPVLSICLATKYAKDIFDQLTWYILDLELTSEYYLKYYFNAFQLTNVLLDKNVKFQKMYLTLESLSIQGHFMRNAIPATAPDLASVVMYLESLLNTIEPPADLPDDFETMLLSEPVSRSIIIVNSETLHSATEKYMNAFVSITKIKKYERVIVEKANILLYELMEYTKHVLHSNIYLATLEYNVLRNYTINAWNPESEPYQNYAFTKLKLKILPTYVKILGSEDSVLQNLTRMIYEYDDYDIEEILPNTKLYIFRRTYNKIIEKESIKVLPSRLCYRDFTIFQLEEFNKDLMRPPVEYKKHSDLSVGENILRHSLKSRLSRSSTTSRQLETNIFIRPNSLKARKQSILSQTAERDNLEYMLHEIPSLTKRATQQSTTRLSAQKNAKNNIPDIYGLPADHHLLKGYNLDDTRQEIYVNTSCYHFEEGYIKFYRERWCFTTMNRFLHLKIKNNTIKFISSPDNDASVIRNLHIITKRDIQIRILAEDKEGPKLVINYPNGLAIYKYEMFVEQVWFKEETIDREERRINTACGSVIVFYKNRDFILVMRFNGEVYQLLNYDFPIDEEEEVLYEDDDEQDDNIRKHSEDKKEIDINLLLNTSSHDEEPKKITKKDRLIKEMEKELNFIEKLAKVYDLSYLHLIISTSTGRIINFTNTGRVYEGRDLWNNEWHDYFANEAYSHREDLVKRIWTENGLKCYHQDGTIIASTLIESILEIEEFDDEISKSSSHTDLRESQKNEILFTKKPSKASLLEDNISLLEPRDSESYYDEEEHEIEDPRYVVYEIYSFIEQHRNYAEVQVIIGETVADNTKSVYMEINGQDQIRASVSFFDNEIHRGAYDEEHEIENENTEMKSQLNRKFNILLCFDNCITLSITDEYCDLTALLYHDLDKIRPVYQPFNFKIHFESDVDGLFNKFVMALATYKNYKKDFTEKRYILERFDDKLQRQGFKFYNNLPILSQFNYAVSNTITEFIELQMIDDKFANEYSWVQTDMKKFPRFPNREEKSKIMDNEVLPFVLGVNVFLKIPHDMRYSDCLGKFMEPLKKICYKKNRKQMKEALMNILNPILNVKVHILYSHNSWERRQLWHQRRLIIEEQRRGLYFAMLRHKKYIKYHEFYEVFEGHVKNIDYFDFVKYQCMGDIQNTILIN